MITKQKNGFYSKSFPYSDSVKISEELSDFYKTHDHESEPLDYHYIHDNDDGTMSLNIVPKGISLA